MSMAYKEKLDAFLHEIEPYREASTNSYVTRHNGIHTRPVLVLSERIAMYIIDLGRERGIVGIRKHRDAHGRTLLRIPAKLQVFASCATTVDRGLYEELRDGIQDFDTDPSWRHKVWREPDDAFDSYVLVTREE